MCSNSNSSSYQYKLSLDDKYFENKLKKFIRSGAMVSSIASLTKLYGNLNVQNSHFVSIIINTKHHLVSTCDSFNNHNESFTNTVTLMRKWIKNDVNH